MACLLFVSAFFLIGVVTASVVKDPCSSIRNVTRLYSPTASGHFYDALDFNLQNLRFTVNTTAKPAFIAYPEKEEEFRLCLQCAKRHSLQLLVRSGGHSYEGLSSTSDVPFMILDLASWHDIQVDAENETAVVQAGATLGELYYAVWQADASLGFTAGSCPTVGSGGHISGGGFGLLSRKYGLAADHVMDVSFMDCHGNILSKESMPEDLFWALRGGGGGSFGIVLSWTVRLVHVPPVVSVFNVQKTSSGQDGLQEIAQLLEEWQKVGPVADEDLYLSVYLAGTNGTTAGHRRPEAGNFAGLGALFHGQFLGPKAAFLEYIDQVFPQLGITASDVQEMSWISSILYFSGLPSNSSLADLTSRWNPYKGSFKAKSDYVTTAIPIAGILEAFALLEENPAGYMLMDPYGGFMNMVPSDALPFPHRQGTLFSIQYQVIWQDPLDEDKNVVWMRRLHDAMEPYVSSEPRQAYVNYLDLDLGTHPNGTSFGTSPWMEPYYMENSARLMASKQAVDPRNCFRNVQSIPLLY